MSQTDDKMVVSKRELAAYVSSMRYVSRMMLGQTAFGGARDYYAVLGYPTEITLEDYRQRYRRQDIAKRVISLPAMDTWKRPPQITEDGNDGTPFCTAWRELVGISRLGVWNRLMRADKLSGIGHFGVLLLGLRDGGELGVEVQGGLSGPEDVLYLRPFAEDAARIHSFDEETQSERFGLPSIYELKLSAEEDWAKVHWSRILHVAEEKESDEVYGTPRLEAAYNRLDDLIKLVGGSAEATWLGMRPGTLMSPRDGFRNTMSDEDIEEEIEDYAHDPLRMMFLEGIEATQLGPSQVIDVKDPFDVCLSLISAESGIPQRVLIGSAQGEQAAAEWDQKQWAGVVATRQTTYVEPEMLRPFIDRLVDIGVLPEPSSGKYHVGELDDRTNEWQWPSILEKTDVERAEIEHQRAQAASAATGSGQWILSEGERRELLNHPRDWPEGEERPEPGALQIQQVRVIPEGSELPVLDVPDEVVISDTDIEQALADWDEHMPHLRGMLGAEVEGQEEYDGTQY